MILRLTVQLPLVVFLPESSAVWDPGRFSLRDTEVVVYPPYKSRLDPAHLYGEHAIPLSRQPLQLARMENQPFDFHALYAGGPVVAADALRLDLHRADFDRDQGKANVELAFEALNIWLERLRLTTFANALVPLRLDGPNPWLVEYLTDDESPAFPERPPGFGAQHAVVGMNITPAVWERLNSVSIDPGAAAAAHLLMDARRISDHIGASIVLAYTAVETRIESALEVIARRRGVDTDLWSWINNRSDIRARPSTEERWDVLLVALGSASLKSSQPLWEGFKELRRARNSFVHAGTAFLTGRNIAVTHEKAFELITRATQIVDWIEAQLPIENRRPPVEEVEGFEHSFTI